MPSDRELYEQYLYEQYQNEMKDAPKVNTKLRHESIGFGDRALIKNLGSPESGAQYLKEKYPDLDVKLYSGHIAVRKPDEKEYKVVDPEGFDLEDITDVAYDVGAGVTEGLAGAAGAVLGNLPGAMAGAGTAGAGLEALRQKLGQAAGLPQDVNMEEVALSGGLSAAGAGLLGTGAKSTINALRNTMQKAGLEGASSFLEKQGAKLASESLAEQGLIPTYAKKLTGKIGGGLTGIKGDLFERAIDLSTGSEEAMQKYGASKEILQDPDLYSSGMTEEIASQIEGAIQNAGSQIGTQLRNSGEMINIKTAREQIENLINERSMKLLRIPPSVREGSPQQIALDDAKELFEKALKWTDGADELPADMAFDLKDAINNFTDLHATAAKEGRRSPLDTQVVKRARKAAAAVSEQINKIPGAKELNKEYGDLKDMKKVYQQTFMPSNELTAHKRLIRAGASKDKAYTRLTKRIDKTFGTDLENQSKNLAAMELADSAGWMSHNIPGMTMSAPTNIARVGGAAIGYQMGGGEGAGIGAGLGIALTSPRAYLNYMRMMKKQLPPQAVRAPIWNVMRERETQMRPTQEALLPHQSR